MKKPKIVVTSPMNFLPEQRKRLEKLGDVRIYDTLPKSPDEWMKRTEGYEIVCSGKYGLTERIYERKNVFYSLPFVAVGWIDIKKLQEAGNTVSYSPGCNSYAVSEWIISSTLLLMRKFDRLVNTKKLKNKTGSPDYFGLADKKVCVLGKGHIGSKVGKVLNSLGMEVSYYGRSDDLIKKVKGRDAVVNTLSSNESTQGLLDKRFFDSFSGKTFFLTVTSLKIYDSEAMLEALKKGKLLGVADDCGSILPGDYDDPYYKRLLKTTGVIATPHIAYQSDVSIRISNDMLIDNVEAWIKGKPIHLLK
ncbi:NAD(P)-dependent oxidoreductase [Patescibacteria group bacterium]